MKQLLFNYIESDSYYIKLYLIDLRFYNLDKKRSLIFLNLEEIQCKHFSYVSWLFPPYFTLGFTFLNSIFSAKKSKITLFAVKCSE